MEDTYNCSNRIFEITESFPLYYAERNLDI